MVPEFNVPKRITVAVAYATRERQLVTDIQLDQGATVEDGIFVSGVLDQFPEIDLTRFKVGIHGAIKPLTANVQEGDRIEIYRPVERTANS